MTRSPEHNQEVGASSAQMLSVRLNHWGESDTSGRSDGRHPPPRGDGSGISVFTGVSGDLANSGTHSQILQITVDTHQIADL